MLTLGITRIIEQESIDVSIWGSPDGAEWGAKPLAAFPQKFYCGTYQILLDLTDHPNIRYLRAKWQVNRWGKGDPKPLFAIYLFIQSMDRQLVAAGVDFPAFCDLPVTRSHARVAFRPGSGRALAIEFRSIAKACCAAGNRSATRVSS